MTEEEKLKKQLQDYKQAVEATKAELRDLRTEKAKAAQVTLSQLQRDIPVLESKARELRSVLADLEKKIEVRDLEYRKQNEDLSAQYSERYSKMEFSLKQEYMAKNKELQALVAKNMELSEKLAGKESKVFTREVAVDKRQEELDNLGASLAKLNDDLNRRESDIKILEKSVKSDKELSTALFRKKSREIADKENELERRLNECAEAEKKALEIIANINEIEAKTRKSEDAINLLEKKESDIRKAEVRIVVAKNELLAKETKLSNKENELKRREENIRKLERQLPI